MRLWKRITAAFIIVLVITLLVTGFAGGKSTRVTLANGDSMPYNLEAFMSVTGQSQGKINGSVNLPGRENTIALSAFNHLIDVPFNDLNGNPTGVPQHHKLIVTKVIDKSSVKLYQALVNGEKLSNVTIAFYRIIPDGSEQLYYTITLTDAIIVSIENSAPKKLESDEVIYMPTEEIAFTYKNIAWSWKIDNFDFNSNWSKISR